MLSSIKEAATGKDGKNQGSGDAPPIQLSISRNLSDRLYEKRKLGALEVEQLIKELVAQKDEDRIKSVIQVQSAPNLHI